jgi:hypothetical protein
MGKSLLFLIILLASLPGYGQQYHMTGRFSNTSPDSISLDSVAFVFTATTYAYYINAGTTPSSTGTYAVITNNPAPDTLALFEDTQGVCNTNGGGNTIKFRLTYATTPFHNIELFETTQSIDSCSSHSYKIQGQYIGYNGNGQIVFTSSVGNTESKGALNAYVYGNVLNVRSEYQENIQINVLNLNGQRVMPVRNAVMRKGEHATFELSGLSTGMYFIIIQGERERKTLKLML